MKYTLSNYPCIFHCVILDIKLTDTYSYSVFFYPWHFSCLCRLLSCLMCFLCLYQCHWKVLNMVERRPKNQATGNHLSFSSHNPLPTTLHPLSQTSGVFCPTQIPSSNDLASDLHYSFQFWKPGPLNRRSKKNQANIVIKWYGNTKETSINLVFRNQGILLRGGDIWAGSESQ